MVLKFTKKGTPYRTPPYSKEEVSRIYKIIAMAPRAILRPRRASAPAEPSETGSKSPSKPPRQ